ncbi:hypothetical protein PybrP1_005134, partial [[Pythium] brassicae (nom. inval.)]
GSFPGLIVTTSAPATTRMEQRKVECDSVEELAQWIAGHAKRFKVDATFASGVVDQPFCEGFLAALGKLPERELERIDERLKRDSESATEKSKKEAAAFMEDQRALFTRNGVHVDRVQFPNRQSSYSFLSSNRGQSCLVKYLGSKATRCDFLASERLIAFVNANDDVTLYKCNEVFTSMEVVNSFNWGDRTTLSSPLSDILLLENGVFMRDGTWSSAAFSLADGLIVASLSAVDNGHGEVRSELSAISSNDHRKVPVTLPPTSPPIQLLSKDDVSVQSFGNYLLVEDPLIDHVQVFDVRVTVGSDSFRIRHSGGKQKSARKSRQPDGRDGEDAKLDHWLWAFYHLFEKFPVVGLLDSSRSLAEMQVKIVCSSALSTGTVLESCKAYFESIMGQLHKLNKPLEGMDLANNLMVVVYSGSGTKRLVAELELLNEDDDMGSDGSGGGVRVMSLFGKQSEGSFPGLIVTTSAPETMRTEQRKVECDSVGELAQWIFSHTKTFKVDVTFASGMVDQPFRERFLSALGEMPERELERIDAVLERRSKRVSEQSKEELAAFVEDQRALLLDITEHLFSVELLVENSEAQKAVDTIQGCLVKLRNMNKELDDLLEKILTTSAGGLDVEYKKPDFFTSIRGFFSSSKDASDVSPEFRARMAPALGNMKQMWWDDVEKTLNAIRDKLWRKWADDMVEPLRSSWRTDRRKMVMQAFEDLLSDWHCNADGNLSLKVDIRDARGRVNHFYCVVQEDVLEPPSEQIEVFKIYLDAALSTEIRSLGVFPLKQDAT